MATRAALIAKGVEELRSLRALERMWNGDASLWTDDPEERSVCERRLGWLRAPEAHREQIPELEAFASEVAGDGIRTLVLCGMGGSSLGAEVYSGVLGSVAGTTALRVVDTTSPEALHEIESKLIWDRTLFLIASKSGSTLETDCLRRYFWNRATKQLGSRAGRRFCAVTDPGSDLLGVGMDDGYRRVFENDPEIGGRYSVLSLFGLVPAALLGVDLRRLLEHASSEARKSRDTEGDGWRASVQLGAAIGACARAGRNKLILQCSRRLAAFGAWAEQLIAESTGKRGVGCLPVVDEPQVVGGPDRVHVRLVCGGDPSPQGPAPDLEIAVGDQYGLGALFYRFEVATALASALIGVEPFDQPNVAEAKSATNAVLKSMSPAAARIPGGSSVPPELLLLETRHFTLSAPPETANRLELTVGEDEPDPRAWLEAHARLVEGGGYLGVLAYLAPTLVRTRALQAVRHELARVGDVVSTLGVGPRYLHSTGQYHKGGPPNGVFFLIEAPRAARGPIPIRGRLYTFDDLFHAQAEGDARALDLHGLPLLRIRLHGDVDQALAALHAAFAEKQE